MIFHPTKTQTMSSYHHLFWLQLLLLHSLCFANLSSQHQSSALLHFKQLFTFHETASFIRERRGQPSYPKMKNWDVGTDCCSWDGVTCDFVTGHVIGLDLSCSLLYGSIPSNTTLSLLPHLQNLNLAFNDFNLSQIPSDFFILTSLTHLNLSSSSFSSRVPFEISHLNNLISLDLHDFAGGLTLETLIMKGLVQNMTKLEQLHLDGVNMSTVVPASLTNLSSSLTFLSLYHCGLQGSFPESIIHLPNLHTLDLSWNDLTCTFPKFTWSSPLRYLDVSSIAFLEEIPDSIGNLKSLTHLDMSSCKFTGSIPTSIDNLTQLSDLDLCYNNFHGQIPPCLSNLHQLTRLSLFGNNLSGEIPNIFTNLTQLSLFDLSNNSLSGPIPPSLGGLPYLASINLGDNSLHGTIPSKLFSLPSLKVIYLYGNRLFGHIDEFQSNSLQSINLGNNRLHGPIPRSIFDQVNLTYLDLSSNNLSGTIELYMFAKLKNLQLLDLSYNSLSLSTTIEVNYSFPQLYVLALSSCNIDEFSKIFSTADSLASLDLSDNKIHGQILNWLFNITTLSYLNLFHNFFTSIERLPWMGLQVLDLHSNLLQGQLPAPPPSLNFFSVSHNNLTGVIPSSFCNLSSIRYLELSNNSLSGKIPRCVGDSVSTLVLDLRMNNFHGGIPRTFANGSQLMTLNLNGNRLEGSLPHSLVNCGNLKVLDLRNNMINDTFPHWLATLPQLQVLILRSNRFYGPLGNSQTRLRFSKLRILDLSHNGFIGHLRTRFFKTFEALMSEKSNSDELRYMDDGYYRDSATLIVKGVEIEMQRLLTIFATMDLSSNKFQERIPDVVGKLNSLILLNFSHSNLIGSNPLSLENLTELESLDLSSNKLGGKIPLQLTSLTFLSVLNLSYNQLMGPIPQGNQFDTFQNDSYLGNSGLCGLSLSRKCSNDETPKSTPTIIKEEQNTSSWFD